MSNIPSNLYAEKIFAEHPTAMWSLDEEAGYISLISEAQRNAALPSWLISNGTKTTSSVTKEPFPESYTTLIKGNVPSGGANNTVFLLTPQLFNYNNLNSDAGNFSFGTYVYVDSPFLQSIAIGYIYIDPTTGSQVSHFSPVEVPVKNNWVYVSNTFYKRSVNASPYLGLLFTFGPGGSSVDDYKVYINGVTVGQWSEDTNTKSLGLTEIDIPSSIALPASKGAIAYSYGSGEDNGYYISKNKFLLARNTGVPLVYGAGNITKLSSNDGEPSLIIPGKGFLNNVGRYQDFTVEFWARIDCNTSFTRRVFGPISSTDGLYVENGYMTLQIGKQYKTHFVSEWFRPMLIHIKIIKNKATVLLNSEEVISLDIDLSTLELPDEYNLSGKNQDWLGFYAYDDLSPIEIDCVAIYPYNVSQTIAKRRFVYGQAVPSPQSIDASYGGEIAYIDYPFSNYAANYSYPDFASWDQGTFNNLKTTKDDIRTPDYQLPQIFLQDKTLQDLYDDNKTLAPIRKTYTNLCTNPSLTNDILDWYTYGSATIQQYVGDGHYGNTSLIVTTSPYYTYSGGQTWPQTDNEYFLRETGKHYDFSVSLKSLSSGSTSYNLMYEEYDASYNFIIRRYIPLGTLTSAEGWKRFFCHTPLYSSTKYISQLFIYPTYTGLSKQFLIDGIMFYARDGASYQPQIPYFDGSINAFTTEYNASVSWEGTPNSSRSIATIDSDWVWRGGHRPITFRPNSTWDGKNCYINYNQYNFLTEPIEALYTVFTANDITTKQTLFKVYNMLDNSYFICYIHNGQVILGFDIDNNTWTQIYSYGIEKDIPFLAGVKVTEVIQMAFSDEFSSLKSVRSFFANPSVLKMYVGGDNQGNTFLGRFYGIFFDNKFNQDGLLDSSSSESNPYSMASDGYFNYYGAPLWTNENESLRWLLDRGASYMLKPITINDQFKFDIQIKGSWQDYLPLSYFAKYTLDKNGEKVYDLDFIQFNAALPEYPSFNLVKSYITFQYISEGANRPSADYSLEEDMANIQAFDLNDYPDWYSTKFRVYDNTVIYPRKDVSFEELAICYHLEFNVPASLTKDVSVKKIEFASQALSDNAFNKIGTRYGTDIYPYQKTGFYYDYKAKNPFLIYKGTTPYLYLTRNSGISLYKPLSDAKVDRGLSIPINKSLAKDYSIGGVQSWMYYKYSKFDNGEQEMFRVKYKDGELIFYVSALYTTTSNNNRATIVVRDKNTGGLYTGGISYYLNGTLVDFPVITSKEWFTLGIALSPSLNVNSYAGSIDITGGSFVYNNISFYKANELQQSQSTRFRQWLEVKDQGGGSLDWLYWFNSFTWNGLLLIGQQDISYSVNPAAIYKTYTGTNKIIIDDNKGLTVDIDKLNIRRDISWQSSTLSAL